MKKNKLRRFLIILLIMVLPVPVYADYGTIEIDGYYDDWEDKPHTEVYNGNNPPPGKINYVSLFRDEYNAYVHIEYARKNNQTIINMRVNLYTNLGNERYTLVPDFDFDMLDYNNETDYDNMENLSPDTDPNGANLNEGTEGDADANDANLNEGTEGDADPNNTDNTETDNENGNGNSQGNENNSNDNGNSSGDNENGNSKSGENENSSNDNGNDSNSNNTNDNTDSSTDSNKEDTNTDKPQQSDQILAGNESVIIVADQTTNYGQDMKNNADLNNGTGATNSGASTNSLDIFGPDYEVNWNDFLNSLNHGQNQDDNHQNDDQDDQNQDEDQQSDDQDDQNQDENQQSDDQNQDEDQQSDDQDDQNQDEDQQSDDQDDQNQDEDLQNDDLDNQNQDDDQQNDDQDDQDRDEDQQNDGQDDQDEDQNQKDDLKDPESDWNFLDPWPFTVYQGHDAVGYGYFTLGLGEPDEAEFYIPLDTITDEVDGITEISMTIKKLGKQSVICVGADTAPYIGIAISSAIVLMSVAGYSYKRQRPLILKKGK